MSIARPSPGGGPAVDRLRLSALYDLLLRNDPSAAILDHRCRFSGAETRARAADLLARLKWRREEGADVVSFDWRPTTSRGRPDLPGSCGWTSTNFSYRPTVC